MSQTTAQPAARCPRCRYDLTGTAGRDCAECGLAVSNPEAVAGVLYRPALAWFMKALVLSTFVLVVAGGTVTSKDVGLSVPDWPTTYGQNMFLFPPSLWKGGVFYEHVHRLLGSLVGMLCIGSCVWLWLTQRARPWLRGLGVGLLVLVIIQGVMGGLRVTQINIGWAILHGVTAQIFLCLTVLGAAATGRWWTRQSALRMTGGQAADAPAGGWLTPRRAAAALLVIMGVQLGLGATMRHLQAGLAIPDFPTSYGQPLPPMSDGAIQAAAYEIYDYESVPEPLPTAGKVHVHFAHRVWAVAVIVASFVLLRQVGRRHRDEHGRLAAALARPAMGLMLLLTAQLVLGVLVIWTGHFADIKPHPEVATAHQVTGAALLATAALLTMRLFVLPQPRRPQPEAPAADAPLAVEGGAA